MFKVSGKIPPGKKTPGKMPPEKITPGNKPPKKIAPWKTAYTHTKMVWLDFCCF